MNFDLLGPTLDTLLENKITPNLVGHHGIGKTEYIRQYAKERGFELLEFRLGMCSDAGDLVGVPHIKEVGDLKTLATLFATPEFFPREGKYILFFDEWNRCQVKEIYQALFNLILEGKMNQYTLPKESRVILACNPASDDYDVFDFNDAAFHDRVCSLKIQPTTKEYLDFNRKIHPESKILDFLSNYQEMKSAKVEEFKLQEPKFSGRTWSRLMKIEESKPDEEVFKNILLGMVGIVATQRFIKHTESLVTLKGKDVLNNFAKIKPHVERLSAENKLDVINVLAEDIIRELNELDGKDKWLTSKQNENLVEFTLTVPRDFSYAFLKEKLRFIRIMYPKQMDSEDYCFAKDQRLSEHFSKTNRKKA